MMDPEARRRATIWVTRPRERAQGLCRLVRRHGERAVCVPAIEIVPLSKDDAASGIAERAARADRSVFVSPAAVDCAVALLPARALERLRGLETFCPGAGTAVRLCERGFRNVRYPMNVEGSEALLALDALDGERVRGTRLAIFRGVGGRELLKEELERRGAEVRYVETYRRLCPRPDPAELQRLMRQEPPDAVVVTGCEALRNLYNMFPETLRPRLLQARPVLTSERACRLAVELGFRQPPIPAKHSGDNGLWQGLESWLISFKEASG